jgi:hypothetical protein
LLKKEALSTGNFGQIANLVASLLLDKRLAAEQRKALWGYYELIRADPKGLVDEGHPTQVKFEVMTGRRSAEPVPDATGS